MNLVAVIALTSCGLWCALYLRALWVIPRVELFEAADTSPLVEWPSLSVIVPACNEGDTIAEALESLRRQDYPNLEIIVVNDRSTDATGRIVETIAQSDPRIVAVHNDALPDGWLGKVHALHVGVQRARGELLLFTDADVNYGPGALCDAVAKMCQRELDHVTIVPMLSRGSFLLDVVLSAFGVNLLAGLGLHHMRDPARDEVVGVGAFNLARRETFERTPGFEWLRMEVADDTGLAIMLRNAGARQDIWLSREKLTLAWYGSLPAMIRGLEKNMFGVAAKYSLGRAIGIFAFVWTLVVAPAFVLVTPGGLIGAGALGMVTASSIAAACVGARHTGRSVGSLLALPIGQAIIGWAALRSAIIGTRNGGIEWRGTHYPLAELRAKRRVDV